MQKIKFLLAVTIAATFLISCNVYSPLATKGSETDIIDAARQCLHSGDYDCAIANYELLQSGEYKDQKLCLVRLAKGGVTISALTSTLKSSTTTMIGAFARTMVPWTQTKQTALDDAKTNCTAYAATNPTTDAGTKVLLKSLGLLSHCAIRIAKTDIYLGNADGDTVCTTAGDGTNTLTTADIGGNGGGALGGGTNGMCSADVDTCNDDLVAAPTSTDLSNVGLSELGNAVALIPTDLVTNTATATTRLALKAVMAQ